MYVRMCIAHTLSLARSSLARSLIGPQFVCKSVQSTVSLSSLSLSLSPSLPPSLSPFLSTFSSRKRPWKFLSRRAATFQLVGAENRACIC